MMTKAAIHQSLEISKKQCQKEYTSNHAHLEESLLSVMERYWDLTKGTNIIN